MSYRLAAYESDALTAFETEQDDPFTTVVGQSPAIRSAIDFARRVAARGGSNILLVGETGTGKEVFARAIHAASPRGDEPFVAINCAAIPPQLLESELFGHERGAFTDARKTKRGLLELAEGGTVFLDEVSSLPLDLQPKLLRALEERCVRRVGGYDEIEVRCRLTAATNMPLEDLVHEGSFREDLFYRLNVLRLVLPPLRERAGDVELLSRHILDELAQTQGFESIGLTSAAADLLARHSWPGNIRELKNALERALCLCEGEAVDVGHLALERNRSSEYDEGTEPEASGVVIHIPPAGRSLRSVEAELVRLTMSLTGGNKSAAARILGISRATLHKKVGEYGYSGA